MKRTPEYIRAVRLIAERLCNEYRSGVELTGPRKLTWRAKRMAIREARRLQASRALQREALEYREATEFEVHDE